MLHGLDVSQDLALSVLQVLCSTWSLGVLEILGHYSLVSVLNSHTSLSRCQWQRMSLTGSPLLFHSIEINVERTLSFQVITPSSSGEILRTGVIVSVTQSIPCLQGRCGRPPSSTLNPLSGVMDWWVDVYQVSYIQRPATTAPLWQLQLVTVVYAWSSSNMSDHLFELVFNFCCKY